jgi:poly-gamma-glutamate capsule biosynthesis protein CapA/YwtB (metallophosphatase superfamily)
MICSSPERSAATATDTLTIGLLGDVMLGRKVAERLARDPPAEVWSPRVRDVCRACDALVLNLECCVSSRGARTSLIAGKPFFFRAPPTGIEALRAIGAGVAGIANNHTLDFGVDALADTLSHLQAAGIPPAGAGADIENARRGAVVQAGGGARLGVLAMSDHPAEFASAPGHPGIAHAELRRGLPDWITAELARLRQEADYVVAFPHWGPNMSPRPAGWQRKRAHELLAAGADAVAGHSAHVFHGVELHPRGPVLYDLGDALDDYAIDPALRNDLGVLALWRPGDGLELVGLHLDFCRTELAAGKDADWIAARLERACGEFGTRVRRLDDARFEIGATDVSPLPSPETR